MKIFQWLSAFLFFVAFIQPASALSETPGQKLKAGIFNFEGYHMRDADGALSGYGIDLLRMLSRYSHLNFLYEGYDKSWQEMQDMLKNGEIDIVTSARRTPSREEDFAFSLPVGRNFTLLSTRSDNDSLVPGDYKTYNGITIGQIAGSTQNQQLEEFARSKGFTYQARDYDYPEDLVEALQKGDVDAILSSSLRKPTNEKTLAQIAWDDFYVIVRKEDKALLDEINYAIDQINQNEGDWANNLYYKYYGPAHAAILELTPRERHYIEGLISSGKKIRATAHSDARPYSYVEDGQLKGILPDYFSRVMRMAGIPFELVAPKDLADYRKLAAGTDVDVVLDQFKEPLLHENGESHGFTTQPYLLSGVARVTRHDFQLPIRTAGLVEGTGLNIRPELQEGAEIKTYPTDHAAMEALMRGDVDAAYVLPYAAQIFVAHSRPNSVYYTMVNNPGAHFRLYIPETVDHELITALSKSLKNMPEGTLDQISSRYTSLDIGDTDLLSYLRANPEVTGTLIAAGVVTLALFLLVLWRSRWNKRLLVVTEESRLELQKQRNKLQEQLAIVEALSRDYSNVYAVDEASGTVRPRKLDGYLMRGLDKGDREEQPYLPLLEAYIEDRVHPEDRDYLRDALNLETIVAHLAEKNEYTGTYRVKDEDGTHYYQFTFVPVGDKASPSGHFILGGFRNIDEMISRERAQKTALAEALAQARYANTAKTHFLNNMSHDIRTPMNAIIGFTALAMSHIDNPQQVERYLAKITTSGNHLLSLINDVLDMSRIESGKMKIEEQETNLPDVLHDLMTIVHADVKAKQLNFQIDAHGIVDETIFCDRLRLNQVLLNVLSNAIKYTLPGGTVSLQVSQTTAPDNGKATYEFRVKDSGIGMSAEFLEHVFEPFERERTSTVSGIQGTGLGLAITHNIVGMMGGNIEVESELGKGSEFTITFHFRVMEKEALCEPSPRLQSARALVVDDDVNSCTSVSKMLAALGMRPDWTTLGKEAIVRIRFAQDQDEYYSAFIIDWMMPDMNGIELARQIRKIVGRDPAIILMTAYDWTDIEDEAREAGVTGFCAKPVFSSKLQKVLDPGSPAQPKADAANPLEELAGKSILVAEDNEMNQEIAQMILENAGFKIDIVENGEQAVEKIREQPAGTYDAILMDVQMPVMDGYEATRRIRKLDDRNKATIPIIAMTANAFAEDRQAALNVGMDGHVAKPIDIPTLLETLQKILHTRG